MTLRLGVYLPTWPPKGGPIAGWPELRALALEVEAAGVDTIWVADEPGYWECWTMLAALAEATTRIEVGPVVVCTRYRNPALLVTMARALDEVSGGRLVLGLGAGATPNDPRLGSFGFDAGPPHVDRFREAAETIAGLLRDGPITFEGRFHRVADPEIGPAGPRPEGPPIWIAAGKPKTMEVAVRWADAVNGADGLTDAASVTALRSAIGQACETVGRDPSTVGVTGWCRIALSTDGLGADRADAIAGTPAAVADRIAALAEAGVQHLTCFVGDPRDDQAFPALTRGALEALVPVLEALQEQGVLAAAR
jgi:alkanesulfonate monooxygenase SsuD/methylene tetrahydromethanopterin reductase-like flavin-dependent oxidoreductase (luciferase family)